MLLLLVTSQEPLATTLTTFHNINKFWIIKIVSPASYIASVIRGMCGLYGEKKNLWINPS